MTAPVLAACYFGDGQYAETARVLEHTARRHCPAWGVRVEKLQPPAPAPGRASAYVANTHKLDWWRDVVAGAALGDRVLLVDADVAVLRPLDALWGYDFDLAFTSRPGGNPFPFNAGVVGVRVSAETKEFLGGWADVNRRMLRDPGYHEVFKRQYGGINQAALGAVLEEIADARRPVPGGVRWLPCEEWNCEDSTWHLFDPGRTRLLHVKSALRMAVFHVSGVTPATRRLASVWRELQRQTVAEAV